MSAMSNLITTIQDEIEIGELSWSQIADKYEVPLSWVQEAADMMSE